MIKRPGLGLVLGALVVTQCGWALWTSAASLPSKLVDITIDPAVPTRISSVEATLYAPIRFHLQDGTSLRHDGTGTMSSFFSIRGKVAVNNNLAGTAHLHVEYSPYRLPKYDTLAPIGTGKYRLEDLRAFLTNRTPVTCSNAAYYYGCVTADVKSDLTHYNRITDVRNTKRFHIGRLYASQQVACPPGLSCGPFYGAAYETP